MQLRGRRFDTGQPICLEIHGGEVASVRPADSPDASDRWPWIAPGLIDIQMNGYGGHEFSSAELTVEHVAWITRRMLAFGVTGYCPTLTTASLQVLEHALRTVAAACESLPEVAQAVWGIHLEGPYLSTEDGPRGAHPREHCRRPSWDEFQRLQEAAGGRIRIHTMAVEFDEAPAFIQRLAASGVVVAIGHTAANAEQIRRAVDAGARLSTHLGNGSHPIIPRHRGYLWDQLAEDRLKASLIGDGHHLPPPVLKTYIRAKTPERCVLISDLSGQAGQAPGVHPSRFCDVEILPGGRLVVAGQREIMAGASLPLGSGVANVLHYAGLDLATAVRMAAHHPADLLERPPGGLDPGNAADLVLFDLANPDDPNGPPRFQPRKTILAGQLAWDAEQPPDNSAPGDSQDSCSTPATGGD